MAKEKRQTRQYLQLSSASIKPILGAIEAFNRVHGDYKVETTLMLLANAWELLGKAILVKKKKNIYTNQAKTHTISCEETLNHLHQNRDLDLNQVELLQQVISLRNKCVHGTLPVVPEAIQHHLFFYTCKFFKELLAKYFPTLEDNVARNFLTLSFDQLSTYAAQVQMTVSKLRRSTNNDRELIWLLERGIRYVDQNKYISQKEFDRLYRNKKKILPHLKIGSHVENADMICIVPVQAPQNFTADITLRKGSKKLKGTLPVTVKKTNPEEDYPYLTSEIAQKVQKSQGFTAKALLRLGIKDNPDLHQPIRAGKKTEIHRYSQKALEALKTKLKEDPTYNPYK